MAGRICSSTAASLAPSAQDSADTAPWWAHGVEHLPQHLLAHLLRHLRRYLLLRPRSQRHGSDPVRPPRRQSPAHGRPAQPAAPAGLVSWATPPSTVWYVVNGQGDGDARLRQLGLQLLIGHSQQGGKDLLGPGVQGMLLELS